MISYRHWATFVVAVSVPWMAALPARADGPPGATPTSVTAPVGGAGMEHEILIFNQLSHLSLTPTQVQQIAQRLGNLDQAEASLRSRQDQALKPVQAELQRIDRALLEGKTPDPADISKRDTALGSLRTEEGQLLKLRSDTAAAIRTILTQPQLDVVRIDVGLPARPPQPGQNGGFGTAPAPGAPGAGQGLALNGGPGGGTGVGAAPAPGGGNGGPGGWRQRTPEQMVGRMMDRMRAMPQDQFDQMKNRIAGRLTAGQNLQPGTPEYTAAQSNAANQLQQLRDMPADQYQQNKSQLVSDVIKRYPAIQNGGGFGGGGFGGRGGAGGWFASMQQSLTQTDDDAVFRLFLQAPSIRWFQARLGH